MNKFKMVLVMLSLATVFMAGLTAYVYAYNDKLAKSWNAQGGVGFSLAETEPVENYSEIFDPLDPWTKRAIENLSATVDVYWSNYSDWKLHDLFFSDSLKVFKYQSKYYIFDVGVFFDPAPRPTIPIGPVHGGWSGISVGWVATLVYKRRHKDEEEK